MLPPDLDGASLDTRALALLGFQRTKQISRRSREAWMAGDPAPLTEEAGSRGADIFAGAVAEIWGEYLPLRDFLSGRGVRPRQVIDIGCGQAINDAFLERDFQPGFTLVDIEETPEQYHAWAGAGSGYASLDRARDFLQANGVAPDRLRLINPRRTPEALEGLGGDLLTSLYSCGFHYPVDEYLPLCRRVTQAGGIVVMDFRNRYLKQRPAGLDQMLAMGTVHEVYAEPKSVRLAICGQS